MWPFRTKSTLEKLRGHKKIKINGLQFVIKRINPLVDFPDDRMPSIFTDKVKADQPENTPPLTNQKRMEELKEDVGMILSAGLVDPSVKNDQGIGDITIDELFLDPTACIKLYIEIMRNSIQALDWKQRVFFWIAAKSLFLTFFLSGTVRDLATYSSKTSPQQ